MAPARGRVALGCAAVALALALGGCGDDGDKEGPADGSRTLTVYSSLPLRGTSRIPSQDMVNAIKLGLQQAGGKVGALSVTYVSLDSASVDTGRWTRDKVLDNARQAVRDPNTIAYIGDRDSAATALSLPLINEGGILQISPSSTYVGLTRPGSGRKGEPERFYPSALRTFGRVVPADHIQAAALVAYMRDEGVRRLAVLHDRDLYGNGLAAQVVKTAEKEGIEVVLDDGIDTREREFDGPADRVADSRADAFFFGGVTDAAAAKVFAAVGAADQDLLLFGPDGVAEPAFTRALPAGIQDRVRITSPALQPRLLPRGARRFRAEFRGRFGRHPDPTAIYAYEAMLVALQAIRDAGSRGNERSAVVEAFFRIRRRRSVLGTYSIDSAGDTSLNRYTGNRVRNSRMVFDRLLQVRA